MRKLNDLIDLSKLLPSPEQMPKYFAAEDLLRKTLNSSKTKINFNGHFKNGETFEYRLADFEFNLFSVENIDNLIKVLQGKAEGITVLVNVPSHIRCTECGKRLALKISNKEISIVGYDLEGREFPLIKNISGECQYPEGFGEYSSTINVPSGQLLFANILGHLVDLSSDLFNNTIPEIVRETDAYAKKDLLYLFVGNTCPEIYKISESKLSVVNVREEDPNLPEGEEVGHVNTDAWTVCAIDYDIAKKLLKQKYSGQTLHQELLFLSRELVVNVKPGVYSFSSRKHLYRDDVYDKTETYSIIERVE